MYRISKENTGTKPEIPDLNNWRVIILGGQTELGSNLGMPGHNLSYKIRNATGATVCTTVLGVAKPYNYWIYTSSGKD
jgi:hypothetical protein